MAVKQPDPWFGDQEIPAPFSDEAGDHCQYYRGSNILFRR